MLISPYLGIGSYVKTVFSNLKSDIFIRYKAKKTCSYLFKKASPS